MRLAITQRVEVVATHLERRDCLDQAWVRLIASAGHSLLPIPNCLPDAGLWAMEQGVQGLILSGGNDLSTLASAQNTAPERDATELALLDWASAQNIPVLGVCRGMQMINSYCGGTLSTVTGHVASKHPVSAYDSRSFWQAYSNVNSFHNWGLYNTDLAAPLSPAVVAKDGTIEALEHKSLPWVGIMWHPERDNGIEHRNDLMLLNRLFQR